MSDLSTYHLQQMESVNSAFFQSGDGFGVIDRRTLAVDEIVKGRFAEAFEGAAPGVAAAAVGGYGRKQLFPYSDVDLLLLVKDNGGAAKNKERIARLLTDLWDSQLRVSQSVRTPADCANLTADNTELHISLLDTRFLCGDEGFFREFAAAKLPRFYLREQKALVRGLVDSARNRWRAFGNTIYHLEPNVKEGPGGLRDFQLACWLTQLENVSPDKIPLSREFLPPDHDRRVDEAMRFLFALRCYLHYFNGRDKNHLSFDLQETIAHEGCGKAFAATQGAADWMREFFRNVRVIDRLAARTVDEYAASHGSLFHIFRGRKSKFSNRHFSVSNGKIFWRGAQQLEAAPELGLEIFVFMARRGLPLAAGTERRIETRLPALRAYLDSHGPHWPALREILLAPYAYEALRAMRETGVLFELLPAFKLVDCLVIRDFYHRYTVDEHILVTIRVLKTLKTNGDERDNRFARLLEEIDRPELLYFALLFHDLGKGVQGRDHSEAGVDLAREAMDRIGLADPSDRETVFFLIREHLAMSAVMTKRDIGEAETLENFKEHVGAVERLKMLAVLTFADTSGVNPRAMSAWRKDLLWQLYLRTHHVFTRDLEDKRIEPDREELLLGLAGDPGEGRDLRAFLKGFPYRYLRTHAPEQIYRHYALSRELPPQGAAIGIRNVHGHYEIVAIAWDRPFLFASLCGAISGFGLNIEKAEAFANDGGVVLDTFRVSVSENIGGADLQESEIAQLKKNLRRVADGRANAEELLRRRRALGSRHRVFIEPQVSCDNETSTRATIFNVTAADRAGLLFDLAALFSQHECDIDVVLIDTRGHRAFDVFYVRGPGGKLSESNCETLCEELRGACLARPAA